MLRLHRSERVTRLAHAETSVALTEAIWSVSVGGEHRAGRFSYRAPSSVVVDGLPPVRIHDYVMIARVGALAATAAVVLGGITQRKHLSKKR
jgi:hypothetical protein